MATQGPQKAILPEDQLPSIRVFEDGTTGYDVRYRIVSEDRNKFSAYSPIFRVVTNYEYVRPTGTTLSDIEILTAGPYVNLVWDPITVKDRVTGSTIKQAVEYDIFLQWGKGETSPDPVWIYEEAVEGTQIGFRYPTQYELEDGTVAVAKPNRLSAEIYIRAANPSRDHTPLLVYKLDNQTV